MFLQFFHFPTTCDIAQICTVYRRKCICKKTNIKEDKTSPGKNPSFLSQSQKRDAFSKTLFSKWIFFYSGKILICGEHPLGASPLTTRRVRASVYEGTSLLTVHTVDPHTVDRSCTPYIQCLYGINFNQSTALSLITSPCSGLSINLYFTFV